MTAKELADYLAPLNDQQNAAIREIRGLIGSKAPGLVEAVDDGKWFRGMITYHTGDGVFLFALGPRKDGSTSFHMMPYYCSKTFQDRYGAGLKKFATGKSCIKFKECKDLPAGALEDIITNGIPVVIQAMAERDARQKK